jgi:hypothetical protein
MSTSHLYWAHPDLLAAFAADPREAAEHQAVGDLHDASDAARATYEARKRLAAHQADALARGPGEDLGVRARIAVHHHLLQTFRDGQAELDEAGLAYARANERYARARGARTMRAVK